MYHKGEEGREEVCDDENSTYDLIDDSHHFVYFPEVYNGTREEQHDRGVKKGWEESDESVKVPSLECHKADLSLAGSKEIDWVGTVVVLREPFFTDHGTESGTKTGGKAGEPQAVDRNRETGGLKGNGWVGYVCEFRVTAVQQLVKEQSRLLLIIWS